MKTVDVTPTWRALIPVLVEVAVRGDSVEGRREALNALYELADFVDRANARAKAEPERWATCMGCGARTKGGEHACKPEVK